MFTVSAEDFMTCPVVTLTRWIELLAPLIFRDDTGVFWILPLPLEFIIVDSGAKNITPKTWHWKINKHKILFQPKTKKQNSYRKKVKGAEKMENIFQHKVLLFDLSNFSGLSDRLFGCRLNGTMSVSSSGVLLRVVLSSVGFATFSELWTRYKLFVWCNGLERSIL